MGGGSLEIVSTVSLKMVKSYLALARRCLPQAAHRALIKAVLCFFPDIFCKILYSMSPLVVIYLLHLLIFGRISILNIKISACKLHEKEILPPPHLSQNPLLCSCNEFKHLKKLKFCEKVCKLCEYIYNIIHCILHMCCEMHYYKT